MLGIKENDLLHRFVSLFRSCINRGCIYINNDMCLVEGILISMKHIHLSVFACLQICRPNKKMHLSESSVTESSKL
jgi:hypothetical protein